MGEIKKTTFDLVCIVLFWAAVFAYGYKYGKSAPPENAVRADERVLLFIEGRLDSVDEKDLDLAHPETRRKAYDK